MEDSKVEITIKHRAPGIHPPLYVAGSFSNPQWVPQLMDYTTGEDGINIFSKTVQVEPGQKYQYKFRVGEGDWWILDETAATVTDDSGNRNNLIEAPEPAETPKIAIETPEATDDTSLEETTKVDQSTEEQNNANSKEPPREADTEKEHLYSQPNPAVLEASLTERQATSTPDFVRTTIEVADTAAELDRSDTEVEQSEGIVAQNEDEQQSESVAIDTAATTELTQTAEAHEANEGSQLETETLGDSVEQNTADEAVPTDGTEPLDHQESLAQANEAPSPTEATKEVAEVPKEPVDAIQVSDAKEPTAYPATGFHSDDAIPEVTFSNDDALDVAGYTGGPEPIRLFAHECAGIYEDDEIPAATGTSDDGNPSSADHDRGTQDFDDPTLEQFPLSRDAIMSTVRKVSTSLNADETSLERLPISPIVGPQNDSVEHLGEQEAELAPSAQQSSLLLPRNQSHNSLGEASQSLQSIAEGAEEEEEQANEAEKPEHESASSEKVAQEETETPSTVATGQGDAQTEEPKADEIAPVAEQAETLDEIIHAPQDTDRSQPKEVTSTVDQASSLDPGTSSKYENTGFMAEQLSPRSMPVLSGAEDVPVIQEIPAVEEDLASQDAPQTQEYLAAGYAVAPEDQELSPLSKPVLTNIEEIPAIEQNLATEEVLPTPDILNSEKGGLTQDQELSPTSKPIQDGADDIPEIQEISAVDQVPDNEEPTTVHDATQHDVTSSVDRAPTTVAADTLEEAHTVEDVPAFEESPANVEAAVHGEDIDNAPTSEEAVPTEKTPTVGEVDARDTTITVKEDESAGEAVPPAEGHPSTEDLAAQAVSSHNEAPSTESGSVTGKPATIEEEVGDEHVSAVKETADSRETQGVDSEEAAPIENTAVEEAPITEDAPTAENIPVVIEEAPAAEEIQVIEKDEAVDGTRAVDEVQADEDVPIIAQTPSTEEAPAGDEAPATEEAPVIKETPQSDEAHTIEKISTPESISRVAEDSAVIEQTDGAYEHSDVNGNTTTRDISTAGEPSAPVQDTPVVEEASDTLDKTVFAPAEADLTDSSANSSKEADVEHSQSYVAKESGPTTEEADSQDESLSLSKDGQDTLSPPKHDLQAVITIPSPSTKPDTDLLSPISAEDEGVVLRPHNGEDKSVGATELGESSVEDTIATEPEAPVSTKEIPQPDVADDTVDYDLNGKDSKADAIPSITAPLNPQVVVSTARDIPFQEDVLSVVPLDEGNTKDIERPSGVEASKDDELPKVTEPAHSETRPKDGADNVEAVDNADLSGTADDSYNVEPVKEDISPQSAEAYKGTEASEAAEHPSHSENNEPQSIDTPLHGHDSEEPGSEAVASTSAAEPAPSGSLTKRGAARSVPIDRTGTPTSIADSHKEAAKGGNWFSAFFRLIFIDLFGGLVSRLCGGRRKTLVTTGVAFTAVFLIAYRRSKEAEGEVVI